MPGIGPRLGAQVDDAARELAPFWTKVVVLDFKFSDRVLSWDLKRQVDVADVQRLTVQVLRCFIGESAAYLVIGEVEWILPHDSASGVALRNHRRSDGRQIEDVSPVEG